MESRTEQTGLGLGLQPWARRTRLRLSLEAGTHRAGPGLEPRVRQSRAGMHQPRLALEPGVEETGLGGRLEVGASEARLGLGLSAGAEEACLGLSAGGR